MSIYSLYEDTYQKIDQKTILSKFLTDNEIKEINSLCDICMSIDRNAVLLSLTKNDIYEIDKLRYTAYDLLHCKINNIFANTAFKTELYNQLINYNIELNYGLHLFIRPHLSFSLGLDNVSIINFTGNEIYNILNISVSTFTNLIYKKFYQNKNISDVFDCFNDLTKAKLVLNQFYCLIYPDIIKAKGHIDLKYEDIFVKE